jgi:LPS sulfotransferase NodH
VAAANLFILLSHERSGSHLVGEYLRSLTGFRMFDEVCNPDAIKPKRHAESFFRFKYDYIMKHSELLLEPTRQGYSQFVQAYLDHLLKLAAPQNAVVDIKYGHIQNFEAWWWPMLERPSLLNICETARVGVLHLFRENTVEATVSSMIADKRKVWHSWQVKPDTAMDRKFELPAREVVRKAKVLEREIHWVREWVRTNNMLEITYERVSAELGRGGALDAALTNFLGSAPKGPFNPRVQKLGRSMREMVENFGELKAACDSAGMDHLVP